MGDVIIMSGMGAIQMEDINSYQIQVVIIDGSVLDKIEVTL